MPLAAPLSTLVVALALTVTAYPNKDEEAFYYNRLHDLPEYKQEARNLDGLDGKTDSRPITHVGNLDQGRVPEKGGGNLLRDLDMLRNRAAFLSRSSRSDDGRRYQYLDSLLGTTLGGHKRTAGCCLDSLGYGGGDLSGSTLGTEKRNMDEIDRSGFNSFVKKNFDEIDRSGFGSFVKRNFDEIDRSGFGSFVKRNAAPAAPAPDQPHN